MPNLIEQMDVLKGLTDDALQAELKAPSGAAPPFLVASEIGRRRDMRQRYENEQARRAPRTTVLDDLAAGGLPAAMPPMGGGGPAAMPGMDVAAPAMPQRGFASGGIVDALDYNSIAQRLNDRLDSVTTNKSMDQALALLAAGAGIMGGGHSNTLQNVGAGIDAGVRSYQSAVQASNTDELDILRSLASVTQARQQDELARLQQESIDRRAAEDIAVQRERLTTEKKPAAVLTAEWLSSATPEQKQAFNDAQAAMNPYNGLTQDTRLSQAFDDIYQNVAKEYAASPLTGAQLTMGSPEEQAAIRTQIKVETYNRIKAAYGVERAAIYAAQAGLTNGDIASGGALTPAAASASGNDPLGLGL